MSFNRMRFSLSLATAISTLALFSSCTSVTLVEATSVQIVVPEKPLDVERQAAAEIAEKLKTATGKDVQILTAQQGNALPIRIGRAARDIQAPTELNHGIVRITENAVDIAGCDGDGAFTDYNTSAGTYFAAIDFLERELGVRFLWPGDCGTYVPQTPVLNLKARTYDVAPFVNHNEWRLQENPDFWYDASNAQRYHVQTTRWLRQHRNSFYPNVGGYGHAFSHYYRLYFKTHPEIFQLLPNGKRGPEDPEKPIFSSMCVTNPVFWDLVVQNWEKGKVLNLNENDSAGLCTCPECLKRDNSPDKGRLERARKAYQDGDDYWYRHLGSLSDRYAYFILECQKRADKIKKDYTIISQIYANYYTPPSLKLNDRILMRYCPGLMFPWSDSTVAMAKNTWQGWFDAGVKLMFRPNCTWDGHNFTLLYYPEFADFIDFAAQRGIYAADLDTLTGAFATNALNLYVIASKMAKGKNITVQELEDDYFRAFGNGERAVRKYIHIMRKATLDGQDILTREKAENNTIVGSSYYSFFFVVGVKFYTPAVLAEAEKAIREAEALTAQGNDDMARRRVAFLRTGFEDMKRLLHVQRCYQNYCDTGKLGDFKQTLQDLDDFRKANEHKLYQNMGAFRKMEDGKWPICTIAADKNSIMLDNWTIRFSPDKDADIPYVPISTITHWELQKAGFDYRAKYGKMYKGTAWYRVTFTLTPEQRRRIASIDFGAVDGTGTFFLNGTQFLERPWPFKGDYDSWAKPFSVPLQPNMLKAGENTLDIRVEKHLGCSGIWRPVLLKFK